eukprot:3533074-Pyramimonas_sp.AAC.1
MDLRGLRWMRVLPYSAVPPSSPRKRGDSVPQFAATQGAARLRLDAHIPPTPPCLRGAHGRVVT